jgi:hypothetical protein
MTPPVRILVFAALLVVAFAAAALAGRAVEPRVEERAEERGMAAAEDHAADGQAADAEHAGEAEGAAAAGGKAADADHAAPDPVRGLGVADGELRVVVERPTLRLGRAEALRFRIVDARGDTVRDFDVEHERRMHLILARRDLTGFQHLHPTQAPDGTWEARATLGAAGSYRLFADFSHDGEPRTLAADLHVDGAADLRPLPAPAATAQAGDYDVRLDTAGSELRFTITRDGAPVRPEPYLGAGGHLVALREGDMAFLHVHPVGDDARFEVAFPTPGRYRLFLQFRHDGRVHTAAFTHEER